MAEKSTTLEASVRRQAESLDPAQRSFVLDLLEAYTWNKAQIRQLESDIEVEEKPADGIRDLDYESKLRRNRHALVQEQSALFGHMMKWLKGTVGEKSDYEMFMEQ